MYILYIRIISIITAIDFLQVEFSEKYEKEIKKFGMLQRYDDSQQYLVDHPHLVCEEAANYLVLWCVNLEVEEVSG